MTVQIPDSVVVENTRYDLCGISGEGLFEPGQFEIEIEAPHSACWRGFVCGYEIRDGHLFLTELDLCTEPSLWNHYRKRLASIFGRKARLVGEHPLIDVSQFAFPILFTGALLLGNELIEGLADHTGHHPAHAYRNVIETTFESGRLLATANRSFEMAESRLCECCRCGNRPPDALS